MTKKYLLSEDDLRREREESRKRRAEEAAPAIERVREQADQNRRSYRDRQPSYTRRKAIEE